MQFRVLRFQLQKRVTSQCHEPLAIAFGTPRARQAKHFPTTFMTFIRPFVSMA